MSSFFSSFLSGSGGSPAASSRSVLPTLYATLKTSNKLEDIRTAINSLYDVVMEDKKEDIFSIELLEALLRVMGEFPKEHGLMNAVMTIISECMPASATISKEIQEAFVRADGVEACTECLRAATGTLLRMNLMSLVAAMVNASNLMSFILIIHPIIDLMGDSEIVQAEAFRTISALLSPRGVNVAELQKIAVFGGALEHCYVRVREHEDGWVCLRLLLHRNVTTRQTFLSEDGIKKVFPTSAISLKSGIAFFAFATMLLEESSGKCRAEMLPRYAALACRMVHTSEDATQNALNEAIFDFLAAVQHRDEDVLRLAYSYATVRACVPAVRLCEAFAFCKTQPEGPFWYRMLAQSTLPLDTGILLDGIGEIGALYCFIARHAEVSLLEDSILIQMLIERVLSDEGTIGGLATVLLCLQLKGGQVGGKATTYTPTSLRQIFTDRIGMDIIRGRMQFSVDDPRLNARILQPFLDEARALLDNSSNESVNSDEVAALRAENAALRKQIEAYREQLLAMEQEHVETLELLGRYDAEVAALKGLIQVDPGEPGQDTVVIQEDPLVGLRNSFLEDDSWLDSLKEDVKADIGKHPPPLSPARRVISPPHEEPPSPAVAAKSPLGVTEPMQLPQANGASSSEPVALTTTSLNRVFFV